MSNVFDADVRYGSSFLDVSKNKQSVSGEIMTDKVTGEVYIKRPHDNKVISFRQKSHTIYEAIQEFNIQFQSSAGFTYPKDPGSYLLGTKLDVDEYLTNDKKKDILLENHEFSEYVGTTNDFRFEVSTKTNGFYIKPITRLGDRNVCGYLAGRFSEHENSNFTTVSKTFEEWLGESPLYKSAYLYTEWKDLDNWKTYNSLIDCTVKVVGSDENNDVIENTKSFTTSIRLNEYSYISFPEDYNEEIVDIYSINVIITKIYAPKLEYERYLALDGESSSDIDVVVDMMMEVDGRVVLQSVDTFYFISEASQLPTNSNTLIDQCIDVEFLDAAIVYLATANGVKAVQSQVVKPASWPLDGMWAEELRDIEYGHTVTETSSVNNFGDLERNLYTDYDDSLVFTDEVDDGGNILIVTEDL